MSIGERIRKSRKAKNLTQTKLAKELKLTRNAVSMWERGKADPTAGSLRKAAVILDKGYEWLATGRADAGQVVGLPLVGEVAGGVWHEVSESQDVEYKRVPVAPDPLYPASAQYALKIKGNSVNRIAKDGTIVHCVDIAEAGIEVRDGDLVWVERKRGSLVEATIKRIRKANGALELWPESDDPTHQEKLVLRLPKGDTEVSVRGLVLFTLNPIPRGS